MEFKDVLRARVSCRNYNGKLVEKEKIDRILEEMQLAPTAGHLQAYRVKVLMGGREAIEKIGEAAGQIDRVKGCGAMMVFFAVPSDASKYGKRGESLFALQDATIACAYAQLAACDLGLASLWIGAFDEEETKKVCRVGGGEAGEAAVSGATCAVDAVPVAILALGYTDEELKRSERKDSKKLLI